MSVFNFILALMFMVFAFVQINDPDPITWILIYGAMAVMCVLAAFGVYPRKFYVVLALFYLVFSIYCWPGVVEWLQRDNKMDLFDDVAKLEHLYIEEAREFLGLMICITVLVFFWVRSAYVLSKS